MIRLSYPSSDSGERAVAFEGMVVRFGSDAQCDLPLRTSTEAIVQSAHGEFISMGDSYVVVGKHAGCPLWVNGKLVQRARLQGGEQIRVGSLSGPEIRVLAVGDREAQASALAPQPRAPPPPERRQEPAPPPQARPQQPLPAPPPSENRPPAEVQRWLSEAEAKIHKARGSNEGQSSGQTMLFLAEALSGIRQTAERRLLKGRRKLAFLAVGSLMVVSTLGGVIWYQQKRIQTLVREKAAIDAQIHALSEAMDRETDENRLEEMEGHLQFLMGSAKQKLVQVNSSSPERGHALSEPADPFERDIRRLLKSFNAETYVIPPNFKTMLQGMVAELVASPSLHASYARRQKYWSSVQTALKKAELPSELGYITFTESRFDPSVRNTKSGAAGMWQLMPITARNCGITVSEERDDRYNPARSSTAAACYLSKLLIEFGQESFMLVLASYNRGENGVRYALHRVAREPGGYKKRDFWHLYRLKLLPPETREYVPRVLAAALVFENPEKYGLIASR